MSKFIDRLKQVSQPPPPTMGFGAGKTASERPKIQLVAAVINGTVSILNQLTTADAILLPAVKKSAPEKIWGLWLKKGDNDEVEQAVKSKADFAVLPAEGTVLLPDTKIGKILQIDPAITDMLLRSANELPVDAFLIKEDKTDAQKLNWQKLMQLTRLGGLLNKPVLVTVPSAITANDMQLIWEAGISGIVIEVSEESTVVSLNNIRQIINEIPYPSKKKKDKMSPTLPQASAPTGEEEEPDEGDDDDDE